MFNTNSNLSLFNFQGYNIRIIICDGEPWFVAKDICEALGIVNHKDAISRLPGSQKSGVGISDPHGREQLTTIISEVALYKLAFRSNKEEAEVFTDWVASVVLPTIRKTGRYSLTPEEPQKPNEQLSQWLNCGSTLLATLSKDEHLCLIHYQRAMLSFLEISYNSRYPHIPDNVHPREEQRPRQTATLTLQPVEGIPDQQTILLDYLRKTGSVTVRHLQQSGPRLLRNLPADHLRSMLQALVENGIVENVQIGKAEGYRLLEPL